jgi:transcriptional regulator
MGTIRMNIIELLRKKPHTALEISRIIGIKEKEVYQHLPHIEKSVKGKGRRLNMTPYYCISCGFKFKDRKRFYPPGRCPQCREERISEAVFEIV